MVSVKVIVRCVVQRNHALLTKSDCGAAKVDWKNAVGPEAPDGWSAEGFLGMVTGRDCKGAWRAFADADAQGKLFGTLRGSGRATVTYKDCWSSGFVGLYVNGAKKDQTETNSGAQKIFRC